MTYPDPLDMPPDEPRENNGTVYVAVAIKTAATDAGYAADVQPRCAPVGAALPDVSAP